MEVFGPVIGISLVLMAVFLPTAALPGISGQLYRQFALTIAASTFFSAVCALTLNPALAGVILREHKKGQKHNILKRGFPLTVYDVVPAAVERSVALGAQRGEPAGDLARPALDPSDLASGGRARIDDRQRLHGRAP